MQDIKEHLIVQRGSLETRGSSKPPHNIDCCPRDDEKKAVEKFNWEQRFYF